MMKPTDSEARRRNAAARLAAAHIARHPDACVLDFFVGSPSLGSVMTTEQLASLRPLCSWECDCGCPYAVD